MKTAISINKELFEEAEKFSRTAGLSRSSLYCAAISEFLRNNSPDIITEKLNSYYGKYDSGIDDELKTTTYRLFARENW